MAQSPTISQKINLVSYEILLNGSAKSISQGFQVHLIDIEKRINKIPRAYIHFLDGNIAKQEFPILEKGGFKIGSEIEIKAGYQHKGDKDTIYKGVIVKVGLKFQNRGHSTLVIECADKVINTTLNRNTDYFEKITDKDALKKIIGNFNFPIDVDGMGVKHERLIQYDCTAWDFMLNRAKVYGNIILVDDGKIKIKKPLKDNNKDIKLTYGIDIIKCDLSLDSSFQLEKVVSKAWEIETQKITKKESSESNVNSNDQGSEKGEKLSKTVGGGDYNIHSSAPMEKDMLKEWANGRLQYARLSKVRGQIIFQGISKIAPNDTIKLDKMGDYFNGEAYVSAVRHEIREGNWITEVEVGMDDSFRDGEANQASASELLPSIQGLYVAIVKQIADDPDGNYRILVDIPLLKESGEGIWARYATGYATSKAGLFFMPEQQDEVIVGFINGDPRFPIVLGSLYSKKHESPEKPEDKNDTKAIITREQLKVTFDEKKKEIIIETPKKNKVTFSDDDGSITLEDQNRNTIKMSSSGIEIDSCKDIKLSANANIEIKAMGNIKESATGNYEVSGLTVKANAQAQLSLKGQISEISGAGVLTVKGGIVRIN